MKTWEYIFVAIALAVLVGFLSGFGGYALGKRARIVQRDTITQVEIRRDTLKITEPKEVERIVVRKELIPITDTLRIHDTTYMAMDIERREYADSDYRAVVSGIMPRLEEISVYPKTKIVTQTITIGQERKPTRFGVGVQVGFGACYGLVEKKVDAGPYIGVGMSYNFVRF